MKFQLKAIVAAVAFATSFPALAQMDLAVGGNDGTAAFGGNSSFVLTVFDTVANVQASFDLGRNYLDFNGVAAAGSIASPSSFSLNLASNADYSSAWTSFSAAATASNIRWAVSAADNYAGFDAAEGFDLDPQNGNIGYITTYSSIGTQVQNQVMQTTLGNFDTYVQNENFQGHVAENGSKFTSSATTANIFYLNGFFGGATTGANALGTINSTLNLAQYTYGGAINTPLQNTQRTLLDGTFSLSSNGVLAFNAATAPIPEADTWAMMLLGLGFMGFVARRRQA